MKDNKILMTIKGVEEHAINKLKMVELTEQEKKIFQLNRLRAGLAIMKIEDGLCPVDTYSKFILS